MKRAMDSCNTDSIRNRMLKHEEIFNDQLHELHRIYKVQKKMMVDLSSKEGKSQSLVSAGSRMLPDTSLRRCYSSSKSESSHSHSSHVSSTCYLHPICRRADGTSKVHSGIDLEQPAREYGSMEARAGHDQTTLFGKNLKEKWIEGSQLWLEDESSIQLTLSIGR